MPEESMASAVLRTCMSAPDAMQQNARLVARSWNYKAKQRRKYSISGASSDQSTSLDTTPWKALTQVNRKSEDKGITFDELFQREVVKMPARMELASQADELIDVIHKVEMINQQRQLALSPIALSRQRTPEDNTQDNEIIMKYRCLLSREVNLVHILPGFSNHLLNAKMVGLAKNYNAKHYAVCIRELEVCWEINTEQINRPTLLFDRAILLGQIGEFKRAMIELTEAIKMDCEEPKFYKLRSIFWRLQGKYIEAAKDSTRAHNIESSKFKHKKMQTISKKLGDCLVVGTRGSTRADLFDEACETLVQQRTQEQIQLLVEESYRIPLLARVQVDMLRVLWKNLACTTWPKDTRIILAKATISMYIVLDGSIAVQTELNGVKEAQRTLEPGSIFSENSISLNLWGFTTLLALANCKILTLEAVIYKHTLRNIMLEGAATRADFFRQTGIFASWTDEQLNTLGILSEQLEFAANDTIVNEGDRSLHLYFVKTGYCGAIRMLRDHPIQVSSVSSGDVFGEAAVLDPIRGTFPFTITALTITKIIRVEKNFLNKRKPFEVLRLGAVDSSILSKIEKLAVRCPADKVLAQMIRDNCAWAIKRTKVLQRIAQDDARSEGKHLLLPSVP
ncbi:hypothetical protein THRCLA_10642, partial [Thraustotheca clavata]